MTRSKLISELHLAAALESGKARRVRSLGVDYVRYTDDLKGVPRGTVVVGERAIFGYPHIGRMLSLRHGLEAHFGDTVWAEEKINGYNVRIARIAGRAMAFTRGGFLCPFTTDRLPDLIDTAVLDAQPDGVLCAEVAGPDNPYHQDYPPFVEDDVELFVFDVMHLDSPGFVAQADKQALIAEWGLPGTPSFGRYPTTAVDALTDLINDLDDRGGEGIVFKDNANGEHRAKYVTPGSNIADIRGAAASIMDLPAEFFTDRVLRLVIGALDTGRPLDEGAKQALGEAFVDELQRAIRQFRTERHVTYGYRCRFRKRTNAEAMLDQLCRIQGHSVQIIERGIEREGDYWLLRFDRVSQRINGLLGSLLGGELVYD